MSAAEQLDRPPMTFQDYLDHESEAEFRNEIWNGVLVARAGAADEHIDAASNLNTELGQSLKGGPCRVDGSDRLVYQPSRDKGVYRDLTVTCGPREHIYDSKNRKRALLNPTLVVEILSPSTASRDLGPKREGYFSIPSLREYVLVDPTTAWVRTIRRVEGGWLESTVTDLSATVRFESLGVTLALADIYRGVPLDDRSRIFDLPEDDPDREV